MAKKIVGYVKLQVPAGSANPSPPIGPALGQRGLNIMEFCKAFNAQTQGLEIGMPIPVVITAYADRTFSFITKTPPVTYFLKKAASITKGSTTPGKGGTVGKVKMAQHGCAARHVPWASRWWSKTMAIAKRLKKAVAEIDRNKFYSVDEAIKI